jgi:hypothetical protein
MLCRFDMASWNDIDMCMKMYIYQEPTTRPLNISPQTSSISLYIQIVPFEEAEAAKTKCQTARPLPEAPCVVGQTKHETRCGGAPASAIQGQGNHK